LCGVGAWSLEGNLNNGFMWGIKKKKCRKYVHLHIQYVLIAKDL
jgi:hypothetical protein